MTMTVVWDNEEMTIVRCDVVGEWDFEQAYGAMSETLAMIETVGYPVAVIDDFSRSSIVPPRNLLLNGRRLAEKQHPRTSIVVIVGASMFFQTMYDVFSRVYHDTSQRMVMAKTLDEARAIIAQRQAVDK